MISSGKFVSVALIILCSFQKLSSWGPSYTQLLRRNDASQPSWLEQRWENKNGQKEKKKASIVMIVFLFTKG